ncbi:MAG: hypothetical protein ACI3YH_07830 [Eubacteriales bacterium]
MKRNRIFRTPTTKEKLMRKNASLSVPKAALSIVLSALLLFSIAACAEESPDAGRRADTTTAATTVTQDSGGDIAQLLYPCEIPDGYTYPDGTAKYYTDQGIWLKEDFYRPDIIWIGQTLVTMALPATGTVRYLTDDNGSLSYPDTLRAFSVGLYCEGDPANEPKVDEDKLIAYLTGLGFELLEVTTEFNTPIFAGTGRAIEAMDCTALQNAIGWSTQYGIDIIFQNQERHSHTENPPEGKLWSCGYPTEVEIAP